MGRGFLGGLGSRAAYRRLAGANGLGNVVPDDVMRTAHSVTLPARIAAAIRLPSTSTYLPVVLLFLSLVVYRLARGLLFNTAYWRTEAQAFALIALVFVGACVLASVRYSSIPWLVRVVMRGIGAVIFVQVLFDAFGAVPPQPNIIFGVDVPHVLLFRYGAILGVIAGAVALWRPAFLVPLFFYYIMFRVRIETIDGLSIAETDYLSLLDTGAFAVEGALLVLFLTSDWAYQRFSPLRRILGEVDRQQLRERASNLVWAVIVGAHLGNYFHSAVAKIQAGGPEPWTWVLSNPTQTAIVIGMDRGINPLATMPWLAQAVWATIRDNHLLFNIFVLGTQLLSVVACLRVRSLLIITLLFDIFHIGVYLTLGALFHFWIVMNLLIYYSAWHLSEKDFTPLMKACCIATTLFGNFLFYTNYLGWLDGGKEVSTYFLAETRDGRQVPVPSAYFGIYSYSIAQNKMYIPDDSFLYRMGGNNLNLSDWRDAISCGPKTISHQDTGVTLAKIHSLVRETDRLMRSNPAVKNDNLYYLYPHHMQPNPFVFVDFNRLKIDDIVGYKYVAESVCLSLKNGELVRDVRKRSEYEIPIR